MASSSDLVARLRAERAFEFAVEDIEGHRVVFRLERPTEVDALRIRRGEFPVLDRPDYWLGHVLGWEGVTEEVIFGRGVGNTSRVDFDLDLLVSWLVTRRSDLLASIAEQLRNAITEHLERRFAVQGNSAPS